MNLGALRRVEPISSDFGWERGQPIDRYYIESFLAQNANDIKGHVLEVADDFYTRRFGGDRVAVSDVLHPTSGNPRATIVADLTRADHVSSDTFDCIIFTQTLQFIYDVRLAVETLYRLLRPGGVLLGSFPGISPISRDEWGKQWYWCFTTQSIRRIFGELFPPARLQVEAHGNVLAAIALLHGLASDELRLEELECRDPAFEAVITLKAVKPTSAI